VIFGKIIFGKIIFETSKFQGSLDFDGFTIMSYQLYLKIYSNFETANQEPVFFYLLPDWSKLKKKQKTDH
jgi:hypothetical protein